MSTLTHLNVIPLAILVLSPVILFLVRRVRYINNDKDELDKRLRSISRSEYE
jgi:hypothetical protein